MKFTGENSAKQGKLTMTQPREKTSVEQKPFRINKKPNRQQTQKPPPIKEQIKKNIVVGKRAMQIQVRKKSNYPGYALSIVLT